MPTPFCRRVTTTRSWPTQRRSLPNWGRSWPNWGRSEWAVKRHSECPLGWTPKIEKENKFLNFFWERFQVPSYLSARVYCHVLTLDLFSLLNFFEWLSCFLSCSSRLVTEEYLFFSFFAPHPIAATSERWRSGPMAISLVSQGQNR